MMDCRTFALLLDTPEQEWTQAQREQISAHAAVCADCAALLAMRREMRAMDADTPLPDGFSASWRNAIRTEEEKKMKFSRFPWKKTLAAVAAVAVVAVGTAVSYNNGWGLDSRKAGQQSARSAGYDGGANYKNAAYEEAYPMEAAAGLTAAAGDYYDYDEPMASEAEQAAAKIIRTADISLRTQEYEADYEAIRALTADCGGRIESLSVSGDGSAGNLRRASFTLRIPSAQLDAFIAGAKGVGLLTSYSESSEDVSESYYDTQSRLETQQAKLQRLTQMMEKAETMSDLIELEEAISDTQYWIDRYTGNLRSYDSRVNDSYVYVNLRELSRADAVEVKQLTLGDRIVNALKASVETAGEVLQALVIFLISALPWFIVLALVIIVLRLIVRRVRRNRKAKKAED